MDLGLERPKLEAKLKASLERARRLDEALKEVKEGAMLERRAFSFLENNLVQLTNVHKKTVREKMDLTKRWNCFEK